MGPTARHFSPIRFSRRPRRGRRATTDRDGPGTRRLAIQPKLFIGNIPFEITAEELRALFAEVGEVVDIHLPKDKTSGKPRGFAFVRYATGSEAAEAQERFDGHELGGRRLRVREAEDRPRQSGPPRGGGRGAWEAPPNHQRDPASFAPPVREDFDPQSVRTPWDDDRDDDRGRGGRGKGGRSKGSRRGLRGKKRSL